MFEHSKPVPQLYRISAKILQQVKEDGASPKGLVYQTKPMMVRPTHRLIMLALQHYNQIEYVLEKSKIFEKEPRLNEWLARILLTQLLWGKKLFLDQHNQCKPVKTILAYDQIFKCHLSDVAEPEEVKVLKPRFVRVNTLKLSLDDAVKMFTDDEWIPSKFPKSNHKGFHKKMASLDISRKEFIVDLHIDNLLVFPPKKGFYNHPAYKKGQIILQDKASCMPVHVLNPERGSIVLDMCAAPGMKTTQAAAMIENKGVIYAVEKNFGRSNVLRDVVKTSGATCVKVIKNDILTLTGQDLPGVQYIIVDPSCTGSGMTHRPGEANKADPTSLKERLDKISFFQRKILRHALSEKFPDVKRVVYSTCSVYSEENEEVVKQVLKNNKRFKIVHSKERLNGPWKHFASNDPSDIGSYCLYAKSEEDLTNGFFVALFERLEEGEENPFYDPTVLSVDELMKQDDNVDNLSDELNKSEIETEDVNGAENAEDEEDSDAENVEASDDAEDSDNAEDSITNLKKNTTNKAVKRKFGEIAEQTEDDNTALNKKSIVIISPNKKSKITPNKKFKTTPNNTFNITSEKKSTITPNKKSTMTPNKKSTITPNKKSNMNLNKKSNITPNKKSNITPNVKSNLTPNIKSNLTPNKKPNLTPNIKSNLTPNIKSNLTPNEKSNLSPNKKSNVTPNKKSNITPNKNSNITPNKNSNITPNKKAKTTPNNSFQVTPNETSNITPNKNSGTTPNMQSKPTPNNKTKITPNNKSKTTPNNKSKNTPNNKSKITPNKKASNGILTPNKKKMQKQSPGGPEGLSKNKKFQKKQVNA